MYILCNLKGKEEVIQFITVLGSIRNKYFTKNNIIMSGNYSLFKWQRFVSVDK